MPVTERTYEQIALEEPKRKWELHRGTVREKPAVSFGHNRVQRKLARELILQLDPEEFEVSVDASRVRQTEQNVYIPDLFVIPVSYFAPYREHPQALEVYESPGPLVVEVWSPSTGGYEIDTKLPEYQARGDHEIWRLHPFDRTVIAWRRRPDAGYDRSVHPSGIVRPIALPGVAIDLDALFGDLDARAW